MNDHVTSGFDK